MTSFLYCPNSDPMRACVCTIGTPDWTTVFMNMTKYPGEAFNIPAVVVGENFGRTEQYQILKYFNTSRTLPKALVVQRFHTQYYQRMRKKLWYFLLRILPQYTMVHNLKQVKWLMIMRNGVLQPENSWLIQFTLTSHFFLTHYDSCYTILNTGVCTTHSWRNMILHVTLVIKQFTELEICG